MRAVVIGVGLALLSQTMADPGARMERVMGKAFMPAAALPARPGHMSLHLRAPVAPADRAPVAGFPVRARDNSIANLRAEVFKLGETNDHMKAELESVRSRMAILVHAMPIDAHSWTNAVFGLGCLGNGICAIFVSFAIYRFFLHGIGRVPAVSMGPSDGAELQSSAASPYPLIPSGPGLVDMLADAHDHAMLASLADLNAVPDDAHRVFHGRGGSYPGCEHLTLDFFDPVWLLTSYKEVSDTDLARWHDALSECWERVAPPDSAPLAWVYQCRSFTSAWTRRMSGEVPSPHVVTENGARFLVDMQPHGRNHGLFLDMAHGRSWVKQHSRGQKVLNLFAYTCAFSVAALAGGAHQVVNIDMNKAALKVGQRNHELNAIPSGRAASFLGYNVLKSWGKIERLGPYGIILIDPPSYQKGSFVAKQDYVKLVRRLPSLLQPDGKVLLCLNAPHLDTGFLQSLVDEAAPELRFVERLANPPSFPTVWPEKDLKVLVYQLPGDDPDCAGEQQQCISVET